MVKNKKKPAGRRRHHSATCKTKPADSHIPSSPDLDTLDNPITSPELRTTCQDQQGFLDRVYLLASVIFQNNHLQKLPALRVVNYGKQRMLPLPEVKNKDMLRRVYELAFNTLKYQEFLEDIMTDSCLYSKHPMPDDQKSLAAVMLYELQDRRFVPWEHRSEELVIQEVRDVERHLLSFKTKLAASVARYRISHNIWSIDFILPEAVRMKQERSTSLPLYGWVNTLNSSLDEVHCVLKSVGFSPAEVIGQLRGQTFCRDPHCGDMLVFPAQMKAHLRSTQLLSSHKLVIQDKSCSLGPYAVCSQIQEESDVLMVGCFSGFTVCHAASLIAEKHKASNGSLPTVYTCVSDHANAQGEELQQTVTAMGCKNVKLISEDFQSLHCSDKRLERVRAILLTPRCSMSALCNPVKFMLQENGGMQRYTNLLQDLSQGSISRSKLEALVAHQRKDIDHALKFSKVSAVVYSTCSSHPEENEEVVNRALEESNARSEEQEPKQAGFRSAQLSAPPSVQAAHPKTVNKRHIIRLSASPFSFPDQDPCPFFKLKPSGENNGCFLAVLARNPEPGVEETPHEVLLRANAKGLLDTIGSYRQLTRKDQHGRTESKKKQTHARVSEPCLSFSIQSKKQEAKGSSRTTLHGHQQQSTQGKAKATRMQDSKSTLPPTSSSSKQESIVSIAPKKSVAPAAKRRSSTSNLISPPPAIPLASVARPFRAQQVVLKPVVLHLPPVNFFPHLPGRTEASPSLTRSKREAPIELCQSSLTRDAVFKSGALFPAHNPK
ncbi:putative methyltransferase NSUN7 [Brachionichthys hirsutus]|uniref:putative methyltransferase NSUN7 n=1 Tax=Brachionichthys hirsutus TaxID=412623 RepID=UPI003605455D